MAIQLKVAPDVLIRQATQIQQSITTLKAKLDKLDHIVTHSKSYWEGEKSQKHQKYNKRVQEYAKDVIKALESDYKNLLEIANVYKEIEKEAVTMSNLLPDDVIS